LALSIKQEQKMAEIFPDKTTPLFLELFSELKGMFIR